MPEVKLGERRALKVDNYAARIESELCYWKHEGTGHWYIFFPARDGVCGSLAGHSVTENQDGTLAVSPSILTTSYDTDGEHTIHGFLTNGIWRDA